MTTIKDIARISGYSLGTVSRVLNNHPDVSDKARAQILAVVQELGFEPNANAKHLKMQTFSDIAVLVKGTQNPLFADILEKLQALLHAQGEGVFVAYLDEDANEVKYALELCRIRRPKGFLFLGGDLEFFRQDFAAITVPSVLLTNDASALPLPTLPSFPTEDAAAAQAAIDYVVEAGHRAIGVLGGNLAQEQISYRRLQAVEAAMARHGLPFSRDVQHEPCRYSMQDGYAAAQRLLERAPHLSAVFALGDVIALGAMRAARDRGLSVPADLSVVGFDGIVSGQFSIPRLTTLRQDTARLAELAVESLLSRLHYAAPPRHQLIPFQLLPRESVQSLSPTP